MFKGDTQIEKKTSLTEGPNFCTYKRIRGVKRGGAPSPAPPPPPTERRLARPPPLLPLSGRSGQVCDNGGRVALRRQTVADLCCEKWSKGDGLFKTKKKQVYTDGNVYYINVTMK